jgi:sugar lactone lactonase YvrE
VDQTQPQKQRLLFLDNLRYVIVLYVLFFHVAAGYSGWPEYFQETQAGGFFRIVRGIIHFIPRMPLLFFVAGYFALPSLEGRGGVGFFKRKFERLGVPWLLCIVLIGPLMPFLGYYSQSFNGLTSASYWDFWTAFIKSGFSQLITPIAFVPNPQYHQMHFWFTSVLLQLYVLMAVGRWAWKKWGPAPRVGDAVPLSMFKVFLLGALGIAVFKTLFMVLDTPSGVLGFFIQFSPTAFATYGGFFILGLYARSRNWFIDGQIPGWRLIGLLFGCLLLAGGITAGLYFLGREVMPQFALMFFGIMGESLLGVIWLAVGIGLTYRYMNKPSAFNARMADNSYFVYLVHYPLILVFRLLLLTWDLPTGVKFALVFAAAGFTSYLLSQYIIRFYGRLAVAGLVGLHVLLLVVGLPRTSYSHLLLDRQARLHEVVQERPRQVVEAAPDSLDIFSFGNFTELRMAWQGDALYYAYGDSSLHVLGAEGSSRQLPTEAAWGALAPLPAGQLVAIEPASGRIVRLDGQGQITATLVDSGQGWGKPGALAVDSGGGIYFATATDSGDGGEIQYRGADGNIRPVWTDATLQARNLALDPTGARLFFTTAGDTAVSALDIGADGALGQRRFFAELFRADGRYGARGVEKTVDADAGGMVVDTAGRLYVSSRFGVQVFAATGDLLGIINFPVPIGFRPKQPRSCALGGPDGSLLYVACNDEVYVVPLQLGAGEEQRDDYTRPRAW